MGVRIFMIRKALVARKHGTCLKKAVLDPAQYIEGELNDKYNRSQRVYSDGGEAFVHRGYIVKLQHQEFCV